MSAAVALVAPQALRPTTPVAGVLAPVSSDASDSFDALLGSVGTASNVGKSVATSGLVLTSNARAAANDTTLAPASRKSASTDSATAPSPDPTAALLPLFTGASLAAAPVAPATNAGGPAKPDASSFDALAASAQPAPSGALDAPATEPADTTVAGAVPAMAALAATTTPGAAPLEATSPDATPLGTAAGVQTGVGTAQPPVASPKSGTATAPQAPARSQPSPSAAAQSQIPDADVAARQPPASATATSVAPAGVIALTGQTIAPSPNPLAALPPSLAMSSQPVAPIPDGVSDPGQDEAVQDTAAAAPAVSVATATATAAAASAAAAARVRQTASLIVAKGASSGSAAAPAPDAVSVARPVTPVAVVSPTIAGSGLDDGAGGDGTSDTGDASAPDGDDTSGSVGLQATMFGAMAGQTVASDPGQTAAGAPMSATTADLAAQMAARLASGGSRFQLQLNPEGLGRVDVQVTVGADRAVRAELSFADPTVAGAIRAHAAELQGALQQAGFNVPTGAMQFNVQPMAGAAHMAGFGFGSGANPGSNGGQSSGSNTTTTATGAASAFAADDAGAAAASAYGGGATSQLDIRI